MMEIRMNTETKEVMSPEDFRPKESNACRTFNGYPRGYQIQYGGPEGVVMTSLDSRIADSSPLVPEEGILGTARTPMGNPTVDIKPDTHIWVNGMEMTVDTAVRTGILKKAPDGRYMEQAFQRPSTQEEPEQHVNDTPLAPEGVDYINELSKDMPEYQVEALAHAMINSFGSDDPERTLKAYASCYGKDPGEVMEAREKLHAVFSDQAARYLSARTGGQGKDILEWASGEYHPETLQQVLRLQVFGNDMRGYDAIVNDWLKQQAQERFMNG